MDGFNLAVRFSPISCSRLVAGPSFIAAFQLESDLVANSLQATATQLGVTSLFLGVILLALIGNASDIISAVYSPARIGWDL